jgi:hypothetical protein
MADKAGREGAKALKGKQEPETLEGNKIVAAERKAILLFREITESATITSVYKAYGKAVTVKSRFAGEKPLDELYFSIVRRKLKGRGVLENVDLLSCG